MTNHLPECESYRTELGGGCICQYVRACEQRAEAGAYNAGYVDGSKDAREGAFHEAREAVARVGVRKDTSYDMRILALAAIDSLRGMP